MSYLYVPGLGDSTSELNSQQAEWLARSVMWRGKPMRQQFWSHAWRKHSWLRRLSGVTSPPSTVRSGVESLISSLRATRVSRSLPLESVLELMTRGTSGPMSHASSGSAELDLFSSRTSPAICPSDSTKSAATFKAWTTGLRRASSARRKSAQAISERDCSSWPTPTEDNANNQGGPSRTKGAGNGGYSDQTVSARTWPTPRTAIPGSRKPGTGGRVLAEESLKWQTPTVTNAPYTYANGNHDRTTEQLARQAQNWHKPCVADSDGLPRYDKRASPGHTRKIPVPNIGAQAIEMFSRLGRPDPTQVGQESQNTYGPRRLNPRFVEWLMGWPLGWTDFAPVGTEWYRWQRHMLSELSRLHWQDA